jgi:hypothetical protein
LIPETTTSAGPSGLIHKEEPSASVNADDDDFSDFVTAPAQQPGNLNSLKLFENARNPLIFISSVVSFTNRD